MGVIPAVILASCQINTSAWVFGMIWTCDLRGVRAALPPISARPPCALLGHCAGRTRKPALENKAWVSGSNLGAQ